MNKHLSIFFIIIIFILSSVQFSLAEAEAETKTDSSVSYVIELGDGQGAILIFGDNNTIYLPDVNGATIDPNQITTQDDRINLVLTDTELIIDGTKTLYSRLVFVLTAETWELVWFEQ